MREHNINFNDLKGIMGGYYNITEDYYRNMIENLPNFLTETKAQIREKKLIEIFGDELN